MKIFYYEPLAANPSEIFTELTNGKTVSIAELAKWYEKRNKEEPERWITTRNKVRVPIFKGQSEDQAIEQFFKKKDKEKALQQPKIFKDGQDANDYFYNNESYKKWAEQLTTEEIEALADYTSYGYKYINTEIREGRISAKTSKQIKDIDNLIKKFELKTAVVLYRVIPSEIGKEIKNYYRDTAYASASFLKDAFGRQKDTLLIINIPAGKGYGAYINNYSDYRDLEYEFLIKRNALFNVISKQEINGRLVIEMELDEGKENVNR